MESLDVLVSESEKMMSCLMKAPELLPSKFWEEINRKNLIMLEREGIDNFKRTVSQNYYNWLITGEHPQIDFLRSKHPILSKFIRFFIAYEKQVKVMSILEDEAFFLTPKQMATYAEFVGLLWIQMKRLDKRGLAERVHEPDTGNPIQIHFKLPFLGKQLISQDLANSIIECDTLADLAAQCYEPKVRIAELGAGSGRLAHVFTATQNVQYYIFDIPPALALAQSYLRHIFPDKKIACFKDYVDFEDIESGIIGCDIAFFTSNQMSIFPDRYFNVMSTISTLPEMTPEQVEYFIHEFDRLSSNFIFIKQWLEEWENPQDGTMMHKDDYYFSKDNWELVIDKVDPTNPQFFNQIWRR